MIDTNGDGTICVSELRNLVEKAGNSMTHEELVEMVPNIIKNWYQS